MRPRAAHRPLSFGAGTVSAAYETFLPLTPPTPLLTPSLARLMGSVTLDFTLRKAKSAQDVLASLQAPADADPTAISVPGMQELITALKNLQSTPLPPVPTD